MNKKDIDGLSKRIEAFYVNSIDKALGLATWNEETRIEALLLVNKERDRQDAKWGEQNHSPEHWVGILGEEYGEYCQAVNETVFDNGPKERLKGGTENMIRELTHVAAVAVGAIECLMRAESREEVLTNGKETEA